MINTHALRVRMKDQNVSMQDMADAINKSKTATRQKISNFRPTFLKEAEAWQKLLKINDEQFSYYFMKDSLDDEDAEN